MIKHRRSVTYRGQPFAHGGCHERKNNKGKKRVLEWISYLLRHGRFYAVLGSGASDPHAHLLEQVARRSQVPQIALALQGEPVRIVPFEDSQCRLLCASKLDGLD